MPASTHALTNVTLPYTIEIAEAGWKNAARRDTALARGVNIAEGTVTNRAVADAHGLAYTPLDAMLERS